MVKDESTKGELGSCVVRCRHSLRIREKFGGKEEAGELVRALSGLRTCPASQPVQHLALPGDKLFSTEARPDYFTTRLNAIQRLHAV